MYTYIPIRLKREKTVLVCIETHSTTELQKRETKNEFIQTNTNWSCNKETG